MSPQYHMEYQERRCRDEQLWLDVRGREVEQDEHSEHEGHVDEVDISCPGETLSSDDHVLFREREV